MRKTQTGRKRKPRLIAGVYLFDLKFKNRSDKSEKSLMVIARNFTDAVEGAITYRDRSLSLAMDLVEVNRLGDPLAFAVDPLPGGQS